MTSTADDVEEFDFDEWCRDALAGVVAEQRGGFITRAAVYVEYVDPDGDPAYMIGTLPESTLVDAHAAANFLEKYLEKMLEMQMMGHIMRSMIVLDEDD